MVSVAGGWFNALLVMTCASACVRDNWTYDAQLDAADVQVTADVATDASAVDAPMDTAVDVPAIDASTDSPTDTLALDATTDAPIDVPVMDVPVMDVPVMDVPATDARSDVSVDAPAPDAPVDALVDVRAPDVPTGGAPRPIAPISLGDVTQRRPALRWQLPAGFDGAVVELCRDRACTMVIETRAVLGSSTQPTADLAPRSVVFWRLRGRMGATTDAVYSPTWLFHVPASSASTSVDSSAHPHLDVNGDGVDDVVVGAKNVAVRSLSQMGAVSVFHGSTSGLATTANRLLESPGETGGFAFGSSVANAGDVNGDGYADIIVGAPNAAPRALGLAGAAYVFHGSAAGIGLTAARILEGAGRGNEFGRAVAAAGDVNGDGYADVIVGAPYVTAGGRSNAGTASVFLGTATGVSSVAGRVLEGAVADGYFGIAVAGAGDINGDGYDDVIVGAPYATLGGRGNTGAASVFLGSAAGVGTGAARVMEGVAADDLFGSAVAGAGDVNHDGYDDVVIGASRVSVGGMTAAGTASVFHGSGSGLSAGAIRVLAGEAGEAFGSTLASAGDVNGDGYGDVVIGAQRGVVRVFHGGASGVGAAAARVLSGSDWNVLSVAGAGDVNGDGYDDLIVGTPNTGTSSFNFVGSARVFQGSATGVGADAAIVYEGAAAGDTFGNAVANWRERGRGGDVQTEGQTQRAWCMVPRRGVQRRWM